MPEKRLKTYFVTLRRPDTPVLAIVETKKVRAKSVADIQNRFKKRCILSVREKLNHKRKLRRIT